MQQVFEMTFSTSWGTMRCNIPGADKYWFATINIGSSQNDASAIEMGVSREGTPDLMARGTNYGDQIDLMREWAVSAGYPAPVWPAYIECDDGLLGSQGGVVIQPAQMNWAVWSTLIHGARAICYFSAASDDGWTPSYGFATTIQSGQVISIYTQGKNTNALVQNLARILNSPAAVNYVTVSPAAYNFGQIPLVSVQYGRNGWGVTGIDVMAKYYTGGSFTNSQGTFGNGFYIFATYRGSQTATDISATFTVAGGTRERSPRSTRMAGTPPMAARTR